MTSASAMQNAPASSARDSASALRDGCLGAAAGSALPVIAAIVLLVLIVAAVDGGGLILTLRCQSRLYISAESHSLGADGSVSAVTVSESTLRYAAADGVPPHASGSREAGMNAGAGAVRGDPGKVRRRRSRYHSAGRLWHLSCNPHGAPLPPTGRQPRLIRRPSSSLSLEMQLASTRTISSARLCPKGRSAPRGPRLP